MNVLPSETWTRRIPAAIFATAFIAVLYLSPMHVRFVQPTLLLPTSLDRAIPFLDWTIWIYYSYGVFLFVPFVACRDDGRVTRVLHALMANSVLAGLIFLVWPTSGVAQHPTAGGLTGLLWSLLLTVDRPANFFPSLHVANTCICAFALGREQNAWRHLAPVWALLIILATVTTKQHFVIDLPGGAALAVLSFWIVRGSTSPVRWRRTPPTIHGRPEGRHTGLSARTD